MKQYLDHWIFYTVLALMIIGVFMVYSASAIYADKYRLDHLYYLWRQLFRVFLGVFCLVVAYKFPYRIIQGWGWVLYLGSVVLLIYSLTSGAGRWLHFGFINVQVSDIARLSMIIFLADSLSRKEKYLHSWSEGFLPHLFNILLLAGLIVFHPDFSSAAMLVLVGVLMMLISPLPLRYFVYSLLIILPFPALLIKTSGYKLARITAFLNPESEVLGKGYQIIQSLISLGSGGIFGVGYAGSKQKMFFLPEAHTDFIFSIIGEEWGLIGTLIILSLFLLIMWRGISLVRRAPDAFSGYLAFGLTMNITVYALANMMVAAHLLPPTGLPLPFISYGGSSMLTSCVAAGLLLNIANQAFSEQQVNNTRFASRASQNWQHRKLKYIR